MNAKLAGLEAALNGFQVEETLRFCMARELDGSRIRFQEVFCNGIVLTNG